MKNIKPIIVGVNELKKSEKMTPTGHRWRAFHGTVIGDPEEEDEKQGREQIFTDIMQEKFS